MRATGIPRYCEDIVIYHKHDIVGDRYSLVTGKWHHGHIRFLLLILPRVKNTDDKNEESHDALGVPPWQVRDGGGGRLSANQHNFCLVFHSQG